MIGRFVSDVTHIISEDERCALILSGIRQYSFRHILKKHPERAVDLGIMEQAVVSFAAGMSANGMIPFLHTWAPFLVDRAYEQIKLGFGELKLRGNIISAGASYDLAAFGASHYCPEDVPVLMQIPNMQIITPGTADEFSVLLRECYANDNPTYFRLSDHPNTVSVDVTFSKANVIKNGEKALFVVVGPMMRQLLPYFADEDVSVLYYTTLSPFDGDTLREYYHGQKIIVCEPYYSGALDYDIVQSLERCPIELLHIGIPHRFIDCLGNHNDINDYLELNPKQIKARIREILG